MESQPPQQPQPQQPQQPNFNVDHWEPDEPLWMTKVPEDADGNPALMAIQNLMYDDQTAEEIAENFKEQGNTCLSRGKRYYEDAIKFYTKAIEQPFKNDKKRSLYYSNRAAVNLLLENFGRVISDCNEAIQLDPMNIKAYFRASKAAYDLKKYEEAVKYCLQGLTHEPDNKTLEREKIKSEKQISLQKDSLEKKKNLLAEEELKQKTLHKILHERGIVLGSSLFDLQNREPSKPHVDENNKLHWPVMIIYEEYSQVDYIEDFHEDDCMGDHLNTMFPPNEYPDWDVYKKYSRDSLEVYAILNQVPPLDPSKKTNERPRKVRIKESSPLIKLLQHKSYVLPGLPILYMISSKSSFKSKFLKMSIDELKNL